MKKKKVLGLIVMILVVISMVASPFTVNASDSLFPFAVHLFNVNEGYTVSTGRYKYSGYGQYYVSITANDISTPDPTNFIVIASNGVQIAHNMVIYETYSNSANFYSAQHTGTVYLRANAGSQNARYNIRGVWTPNF